MEVLYAFGILGLVGAAVGGVVYFGVQQEKKRREALEAKGWRYEKVRGGFRVEGVEDGMVWQYTAIQTSKGSNQTGSRRTGRFSTPAEPSEEIVLMGPPLPSAMLAMGFSGMLVQFLARMVLGDRAEDLARARELRLPAALEGRMSLVGTDQGFADAFLTEPVVQALASYEGTVPAILRWKDSLEIRVHERVGDVATVERVVALGTVLAGSIGYEVAPD